MKDFFKEYWKIAAGCAAGAFLLSFLIGLIARNPFGVVLLRALLLAILFAGLGIGLRYVTRRYLPEVSGGGTSTPEPARERGKRVDITLGEEDGVSGQARAEGRQSRPSRAAGSANQPEGGEETLAQAEAQALGEMAQDLGEDIGPAEAEEPESVEDFEGESSDGAAEDEDRESGGESVEALDARQGGAEDLDTLPDIASLEPDPDLGPTQTASRHSRRGNGGETPQDAMRGALSGQDPATLARAIRTVLSKDEKG